MPFEVLHIFNSSKYDLIKNLCFISAGSNGLYGGFTLLMPQKEQESELKCLQDWEHPYVRHV